jgi:Domain of unknown function (DUF4157)
MPSSGAITAIRPGVPSRVIQGYFRSGPPVRLQPSPAPVAPVRQEVPRPVQARHVSPAAPILPGRPASAALQPAPRVGQPPPPILATKVQPGAVQLAVPPRPQVPQPILPQTVRPASVQAQAGNAFALPANFTLKPRGSGQPLPEPIQKKMESFFNTSFADVRVHVGNEAASIGALAFTHGTDLYFAPGQYNPQSTQGQQLLGHELTHVVQQRAGRVRNPLGVGVAVVQDPALEAEAERRGLQAAMTPPAIQAKQAQSTVQRAVAIPAPVLPRTPVTSLLRSAPRSGFRPSARTTVPAGRGPSPRLSVVQRMMEATKEAGSHDAWNTADGKYRIKLTSIREAEQIESLRGTTGITFPLEDFAILSPKEAARYAEAVGKTAKTPNDDEVYIRMPNLSGPFLKHSPDASLMKIDAKLGKKTASATQASSEGSGFVSSIFKEYRHELFLDSGLVGSKSGKYWTSKKDAFRLEQGEEELHNCLQILDLIAGGQYKLLLLPGAQVCLRYALQFGEVARKLCMIAISLKKSRKTWVGCSAFIIIDPRSNQPPSVTLIDFAHPLNLKAKAHKLSESEQMQETAWAEPEEFEEFHSGFLAGLANLASLFQHYYEIAEAYSDPSEAIPLFK